MSEKQTDHWSWLVSELGVTPPPEPVAPPPAEPAAEQAPPATEFIVQPPTAQIASPREETPAVAPRVVVSAWAAPRKPEPEAVEETSHQVSDWDLLAEELGISPPPSPTAMPPSAEEPAGVDYVETPDRLDENFDAFEMPAPLEADEAVSVKAEFIAEEEEAPAAEGDEDKPRRGRRRRRRGRRQRGDERETPAGETAFDEEEPSATVGDLLADEEEPIVPEVVDEDEPRDEPREERRPRERPRRRRGARSERPARPAAAEDDFGRGLDAPHPAEGEEEVDDELADEMRPAHRAIPTWDEAIGAIIATNMEARGRRTDGGNRGRGHRGHR